MRYIWKGNINRVKTKTKREHTEMGYTQRRDIYRYGKYTEKKHKWG